MPRPLTVLVVDDDPDIRSICLDILEMEGYKVLEAADGAAGVRAAQANHPGMVLMDIRMPVLDGIQACLRLKADPTTAHIPIVLMSAHTLLLEADIRACAAATLPKPFDMDKLLRVVEQLLPTA